MRATCRSAPRSGPAPRSGSISTGRTSSSPSARGSRRCRFQAAQQVIQIDVDPEEIGRNHPGTHGLVGDARATLEQILDRLRAAGPRPPVAPRRARGRASGDGRRRRPGAPGLHPAKPPRRHPAGRHPGRRHDADRLPLAARSGPSTSRAPTSPPRIPATSATASRPRWAPRSRAPIGPSSPCPATAASCSTARSCRRRCGTGSRWWSSCSTTTPTGTSPGTSTRPGAAASAPIWPTPTSCGSPRRTA